MSTGWILPPFYLKSFHIGDIWTDRTIMEVTAYVNRLHQNNNRPQEQILKRRKDFRAWSLWYHLLLSVSEKEHWHFLGQPLMSVYTNNRIFVWEAGIHACCRWCSAPQGERSHIPEWAVQKKWNAWCTQRTHLSTHKTYLSTHARHTSLHTRRTSLYTQDTPLYTHLYPHDTSLSTHKTHLSTNTSLYAHKMHLSTHTRCTSLHTQNMPRYTCNTPLHTQDASLHTHKTHPSTHTRHTSAHTQDPSLYTHDTHKMHPSTHTTHLYTHTKD